jgi:hypothetical protein
MSTLETLMIVFIAVTALAVVIQMAILIALYICVRKSLLRMEALAQQLAARTMPALEIVQNMLPEYRPKLDAVVNNLAATTSTVKQEVERFVWPVRQASAMLHGVTVGLATLLNGSYAQAKRDAGRPV